MWCVSSNLLQSRLLRRALILFCAIDLQMGFALHNGWSVHSVAGSPGAKSAGGQSPIALAAHSRKARWFPMSK